MITYSFSPDEATTHKLELAKLAEKDPEFFKYLQENDKELLDFDGGANADDDEDEDEEMASSDGEDKDEDVKAPALTQIILRRWQKAILEVTTFDTTPFYELNPALKASLSSRSSKTSHSFQVGGAHE